MHLVQPAPNPPVMVMPDNTTIVKPASNPPVMVMPEMYNKNKSEKTLAPTATLYSHGDPTPIEQVLLEYINRARANPKDEGIRIYNTTDPYILSNASRCGVNMKTVRDEFATYPVKPPIAFNKNIITAARLHSDWMVETGIMDHVGRNGSTFSQRMVAAGYTSTGASGENIFKDARDPWFSHLGFQIDWCNPDLGHRQNIMNFSGGAYKEMGIGVTPHSGMIAVTHDFGSQLNSFICGVVYKDNNNNNFYDIGEGLSGVTITASKGNYYAVSSTSGGYAIPVEPGTTGSVTIEAKGGALGSTVVKNAVLSGQNVKVDFTSPLPGQVSLEYPGLSAVLTQKAVTFKWFKSPGNVSDIGSNFPIMKTLRIL
ncbi:MAG: CAP domain-containing protein [Ignavibacteria bacterium]|nr:CAP domain-containing protein [Ignavibacteria bacterium]